MDDRDALTEDQIQGYIDDRLNERDRAAVAANLLAHTEVAAEIEILRRQNEALKGVSHHLDEPVPEAANRDLEAASKGIFSFDEGRLASDQAAVVSSWTKRSLAMTGGAITNGYRSGWPMLRLRLLTA